MKCKCDRDIQDINQLCAECKSEYIEWAREKEELFLQNLEAEELYENEEITGS